MLMCVPHQKEASVQEQYKLYSQTRFRSTGQVDLPGIQSSDQS